MIQWSAAYRYGQTVFIIFIKLTFFSVDFAEKCGIIIFIS